MVARLFLWTRHRAIESQKGQGGSTGQSDTTRSRSGWTSSPPRSKGPHSRKSGSDRKIRPDGAAKRIGEIAEITQAIQPARFRAIARTSMAAVSNPLFRQFCSSARLFPCFFLRGRNNNTSAKCKRIALPKNGRSATEKDWQAEPIERKLNESGLDVE